MECRDIPVTKIEEDEFQIGKYVDSLCTFIRNSETPITIALQGEWGSGKTSFMKILEHCLCNESLKKSERYESIWLDTWELFLESDYEVAVQKLMLNLLLQMEEHFECKVKDHKSEKRRQAAKEYSKNIIGAALSTVKLDGTFTENMLENLFGEGRSISFRKQKIEFEEFLIDAVEDKSNEITNKAFLIFVDDLDRLPPKLSVTILEALKNLFDIRKCIFILAVDYDMVACGIEQKYGGVTLDKRNIQQDFFDKLIQVPYLIPMQKYNIKLMVIKRLKKMNFFSMDASYTDYGDTLIEIVRLATNQNPRSIKRLMNMMQLLILMEPGVDRHPTFMVMELLLIAIQLSFPTVYRMLSHNCQVDTWTKTIHIAEKEKEIPQHIRDQYRIDTRWKEIIYLAVSDDHIMQQNYYRIAKLLEYYEKFQRDCQQAGESVETILGIVNVVSRENSMQHQVLYDGAEYNRSSQTQSAQGEVLIKKIDFQKHRKVLDVGCGSGNTTINMWNRNRKMNVTAFDISESQIAEAKKNYQRELAQAETNLEIGQIDFLVKDAMNLNVKNEFDLIFSNATLHWIRKPEQMYGLLYRALTPGGTLAVHQGGYGTYAGLHDAVRRAAKNLGLFYRLENWSFPAYYPKKDEIRSLLEKLGYTKIEIQSVSTDEAENKNLVDNFANASLIYYQEAGFTKDEYTALKEEYLRICNTEQVELKAHRLYIIAEKHESR